MSRLVIRGTYFDSIDARLVNDGTIIVENGIFSSVSKEYAPQDTDEVIEVSGVILPGLIDCHVHLEATTVVDHAKEMMRKKEGKDHYTALKHAQLHLVSGFTTVRDCGGGLWGAPLRRVLADGMFPGSRVFVAQHTIAQWGNQETMGPKWLQQGIREREIETGPYGVAHAVRERKHQGSDFIKTMTTGGVLHGMESQLERSLWTDEELKAMVTEAHRLGMHVAVHAHGLHGIRKAAIAGVDTIEHCSFVDEDTAEIMIKNNIYLVPTQTSAFMHDEELMKQLEPEVREKTIAVDTAMIENHAMAYRKGVKIACGTDAGVPGNPHGTSAKELSVYVNWLKMKPEEALQSGTILAAEAIKQDSKLGSITEGKIADLVIVKGNPLENIEVLEDLDNITTVIKDGRIVAQQGKLVL